MKIGIMQVSVGCANETVFRKQMIRMEYRIKGKFTNVEGYHAITSKKIQKKLWSQGCYIGSVYETIVEMKKAGITHVYIQPMHLVDGMDRIERR